MGCVSTKKKLAVIQKIPPKSQEPSINFGEDDQNYNSAPQSPVLRKIVQIGALTQNEIHDYIIEKRNQVSSSKGIDYVKRNGRYTPTIIYRYRGQHSSTRTPSRVTNQSPGCIIHQEK